MRRLFLLLLALSTLHADVTLSFLGATQTQALVAIRGASGGCTLALSESATYSPLIPDVDESKYEGASKDIGRADTIAWSDGTRVVTLGHQVYDRALGVLTPYYLQVSGCGGTATLTFTTPNITTGTTQSWPPPFDAGQWGKRGWPFTEPDLLTKSRHIDPLTGLVLYPASNALDWTVRYPGGGGNPVAAGTINFAYWAGGTGWTNPGTLVNGPSSTATTNNTNAIDLYPGTDATPIDAPYLQWSLNDIGTKLFGSGTDSGAGNRQFTVCIFVNPLSGCLGTPITITAGQGGSTSLISSSSTDPDKPWPSSFPQAFFSGWGAGVMIHAEDRATSGTLSAANGVLTIDGSPNYIAHFSSALAPGNKIYIAGTNPVCPNHLCTLASLRSATQAMISENITKPSGTAFVALRFGIRIQKTTPTGSITVGAAYKLAGAININNAGSAQNAICNVNPVKTGDNPPKTGYICRVPTTHAGFDFMYFFATDGTSRMLYSGSMPNSSYFSSRGFAPNDFPAGMNITWYYGFYPDGSDGRTWYYYDNTPGGTALFKLHYDGDFTEDRDWHYTVHPGGQGYIQYPPSDKWTWSVVIGTGNTLAAQVTAFNPDYKAAMYGSAWSLQGISGTTAYFLNNYNGGQNLPGWIAVVNLGTGLVTNLIHTMDGTGTNGYIRFGGIHNVGPATTFPDNVKVSNWSVGYSNSTLLHGGPFMFPITGLMRAGSWSTNTALPWPPDSSYDNNCDNLAPGNPYVSIGATGNQCFKIRVPHGGWCNTAPRADEKATWPCPSPTTPIAGWTPANYAQPFPMRVGDVFVDGTFGGGALGDNENFRIVKVNSGTEAEGQDSIVVQRNSMPEYCCVAPGPPLAGGGAACAGAASQATHATGWRPWASAPTLNGCNAAVFSITGKGTSPAIGEMGRNFLQGHGDLVAGTIPGRVVDVGSGGATDQKPIETLFDIPVHINSFVTPTFHGSSLPVGGGAVQAYASSPGGVPWFLDSNTLNDNSGNGREGINNMGNRTLTATATANVYKIQVLGTVNYKVFPLIGFAGPNNLKDVSGPASDITATAFTLCYALNAGECYSGSAVGDIYVNVPAAYDPGYCVSAQHWANIPCVFSGWPGAGGFRQQGWTAKDSNSSASRFLTYLFDIPGGQYAYGTMTPLDSSIAWGPPTFGAGWGQVTFLAKLPPWQQTEVPRSDFIMTQESRVQIPPGLAYAEVQFGYSRWIGPTGNPAAFQCMPRTEACNTSGQPYNFESQTRTLKSCASGCTINIPVMAPNVLYYRVRRSGDGINWSSDGNILANAVP